MRQQQDEGVLRSSGRGDSFEVAEEANKLRETLVTPGCVSHNWASQ